jgi:hypothetical protein
VLRISKRPEPVNLVHCPSCNRHEPFCYSCRHRPTPKNTLRGNPGCAVGPKTPTSAKKPKEHAKVHISWQEQDDRRVRAARRHGGRELLHGRRGLGSLSGVGWKGEELPHGGGVGHDATNATIAAGGGDCYSHCGTGGGAST